MRQILIVGSGLDREFRALTMTTALAWLFLFESVGGQGPTHPPVIKRFRAAAAKLDLGERSPALESASSIHLRIPVHWLRLTVAGTTTISSCICSTVIGA